MASVACIGECMIEMHERPDGLFARGFGGDTLNTALYMARLGVAVDYVTALGDDGWSDELIAAWRAEGIGTTHVARIAGALPGLYVIQTDERGERRFSYWRDNAPVRQMFAGQPGEALVETLSRYDFLYLSGITLSLYDDAGRARLFEAAARCRGDGGQFAFDSNFRPRGWPDRAKANACYRQAFDAADILLASSEDLNLLFGASGVEEFLARKMPSERVLKSDGPSCRVIGGGVDVAIAAPAVPAVDTTAAGDSFAAAYLAARLAGASLQDSVRAGHRLAGTVVQYPGAIIPRSAMPDIIVLETGT